MQALGRVIKARRQAVGLKQTELAEALAVHPQTISRYETGDLDVSITRLTQIAGALRTSALQLLLDAGTLAEEQGEAASTTPPESEFIDMLLAQLHQRHERRVAERLRAAREAAGFSLEDAAEKLRVPAHRLAEFEDNAAAMSLPLQRAVEQLYGVTSSLFTNGLLDPAHEDAPASTFDAPPASIRVFPSRHERNLPLAIREYLAALQLRLTKGGASEEEVHEAMDLLRSPQLFTFYKGGAPSEYNEEDVLSGMRAIAEGVIIPVLRERGRKIP